METSLFCLDALCINLKWGAGAHAPLPQGSLRGRAQRPLNERELLDFSASETFSLLCQSVILIVARRKQFRIINLKINSAKKQNNKDAKACRVSVQRVKSFGLKY
jgi:hypothetical protein